MSQPQGFKVRAAGTKFPSGIIMGPELLMTVKVGLEIENEAQGMAKTGYSDFTENPLC